MSKGHSSRRSQKDLKKIGLRVRELRLEKELSQEALAELADIHDRTVGEIERGELNFSVRILLQLCIALNVEPNDIVL